MTMPNINKLTLTKKLVLLEKLWNDLSKAPSKLKSPSWHQAELEETVNKLAQGKEKAIDWKIARKRLRTS